MTERTPRFLIARVGWNVRIGWDREYTHCDPATRDTAEPEDRRFIPVAGFADRATAEARMRELELEAARLFNPFWRLGPLTELTSWPRADFIARLESLVGPLPANTVNNDSSDRWKWRPWWDEQMPGWSDETLAAVWALFDRIRFYAVLEVEAE